MPTQPYMLDGKRVPGVTTVLGTLGWNKDALMKWANRMGLEGISLADARQNPAEKAATVGSLVHDAIEADIQGQDVKVVLERTVDGWDDEMRAQARQGYQNFRRWWAGSRLDIVTTEAWFVSPEYQCGGCPDAIAIEPDLDTGEPRLVLLDWKTSSGTYADHVVQVAAYLWMMERHLAEGRPLQGGQGAEKLDPWMGTPVTMAGAYVLRADKNTGMFSAKWWDRTALEPAWVVFTYARAIYKLRWTVEKLTK